MNVYMQAGPGHIFDNACMFKSMCECMDLSRIHNHNRVVKEEEEKDLM